jgi:hypothetical protein
MYCIVVLLAPAFEFLNNFPERIGSAKMDEWKKTNSLLVYHYLDKKERSVGYGLYEDALHYEKYPKVTQPCVIFHGKGDDSIPYNVSVNFAKNKPNVELNIVDSDHQLVNIKEVIWNKIEKFIFE